jgi:hypothetical protein
MRLTESYCGLLGCHSKSSRVDCGGQRGVTPRHTGPLRAAGVDEFIVPGFRPQSPDETIVLIDVLTSEVLAALRCAA